jgi:Na+/H+-dicarboxylate symporter
VAGADRGGYFFLGRDVFRLMRTLRAPLMIGFATASSESAYPKVIDQLTRFGVKPRITNFVLPLGYSFNLDGSIMYTSLPRCSWRRCTASSFR